MSDIAKFDRLAKELNVSQDALKKALTIAGVVILTDNEINELQKTSWDEGYEDGQYNDMD